MAACVLPGCVSQASDEYRFYDDFSEFSDTLPTELREMTAAMNTGEYATAKQQAESIIVKLDAYKKKLGTYSLKNSQAQLAYAEVVPYVSLTKSGLEYFIQSMDAMISGDVKQANKYIDLATVDIADAENHLETFNQILP
ncbi:hypothetical protein DSECCO2_248710 [anaerobic digester metagenome]